MLVQLASNVWKINEDSNLYIIKLNADKNTNKNNKTDKLSSKIIVIDTCPRSYRKKVEEQFNEVADPRDVAIVLFTHFHYDHIGNFEMFPNAKFYASENEITFFKKDGFGAVLNKKIAEEFSVLLKAKESRRLFPLVKIKKFLAENKIEYYDASGHTAGSVLYFYKEHSMLFTGDTYFGDSCYGRTDLPSSFAEKMPQTLKMLKNIPYNILCGGHDYI